MAGTDDAFFVTGIKDNNKDKAKDENFGGQCHIGDLRFGVFAGPWVHT